MIGLALQMKFTVKHLVAVVADWQIMGMCCFDISVLALPRPKATRLGVDQHMPYKPCTIFPEAYTRAHHMPGGKGVWTGPCANTAGKHA